MAEADAPAPSEGALRRYVWVAVLLSLATFGLGQLYNGRLWWLAALVAAWFSLLALFQTDVPSSFAGLVFVVGGLLAVQMAAVVHTGVTAWRNPVIARQPFHRWYVYVVYAALFALTMPADEAEFGALFGPYTPFRVTATHISMEPTLRPGDYFLVRRVEGDERRELARSVGAIVAHGWADSEGAYVHRLVATATQSVGVSGMDVLIDGKALSRDALCSTAPEPGGEYDNLRSKEVNGGKVYAVQHLDGEMERDRDAVTVPEDSFFVLGDSRDLSNDSRYHGAVPTDQLVGVALFIFWADDWQRVGRSLTVDSPAPTRADACGAEP